MPAAPALAASDAAAELTAEIVEGHREAFAAPRQIIKAALQAVTGASTDSSSSLPPPKAGALSIALKAQQEYACHMGFPPPFSFTPQLPEKLPGRAEQTPSTQLASS